jgi:hypothetical protein
MMVGNTWWGRTWSGKQERLNRMSGRAVPRKYIGNLLRGSGQHGRGYFFPLREELLGIQSQHP